MSQARAAGVCGWLAKWLLGHIRCRDQRARESKGGVGTEVGTGGLMVAVWLEGGGQPALASRQKLHGAKALQCCCCRHASPTATLLFPVIRPLVEKPVDLQHA